MDIVTFFLQPKSFHEIEVGFFSSIYEISMYLETSGTVHEYEISVFLAESDKLQSDLQKVEQLEEKINTELVMLREKIATMEKELEVYSDLSMLKEEAEKKRNVSLQCVCIHLFCQRPIYNVCIM